MPIWDDHQHGLNWLSYVLNYLQTDSVGFRHPLHPERVNANPAYLCRLKGGVGYYADHYPEFAPFLGAVLRDYSSPDTNPATFQQPIYYQLREVIQSRLRQA